MEKFWIKIAQWVPHQLAYWCAVRVVTNATTGPYSNQVVPDLTAMDALQRWESV